jgi:hypothetical protein
VSTSHGKSVLALEPSVKHATNDAIAHAKGTRTDRIAALYHGDHSAQ